ncbi:ferredoxin [Azovibrio restrictus]|uniref:(2Fe-2S) ferredoxin domain-containing protein n=1 Tax=Azovibrio restrictus TaxID=146938 RepID=UPI000410B7E5|nr:NAD(P)H-dependent oxidoreductase subunit E [Azovibrio restrictus]MCE1171889.1 NAD(P)H-dependent oxidoreductase subunit E [Azovibrio sp.]MDD3483775.1 NAD(P)H-dependent oxidoreductase subunit E [Azovibrio restrictus]
MSHFKKHVFICCNQRPEGESCCNNQGATEMFQYAKNRARELGLDAAGVRVNKAGCLGRCDQGPVLVVYPEGTWYTFIDQEDVEEIIQTHLVQDKIVERLQV